MHNSGYLEEYTLKFPISHYLLVAFFVVTQALIPTDHVKPLKMHKNTQNEERVNRTSVIHKRNNKIKLENQKDQIAHAH